MQPDDSHARSVLERAGLAPGDLLGWGVEGVVLALSEETVAKVWSSRSPDDLVLLRRFLDDVDDVRPTGGTVALPHIEDLLELDGTLVTVERRLVGRPLWNADGTSPDVSSRDIDVMTEALATLASIPGTPELRALPVLPDEPAIDAARPFELELAGLVARRHALFAAALVAACPDADTLAERTVSALRALTPADPTLVHGDLIAANVLHHDEHATAVLDFGFLSTAGDPAFDAAVAASCYDMWGPRAREVERELDAAFSASFGHDPARLMTYRAAYALVTACCFGTDRSDGHFAWCVDVLDRGDVREALGC